MKGGSVPRAVLLVVGIVMGIFALAYVLPILVPQLREAEEEQVLSRVGALSGNQNPYKTNMSNDFTFCLGILSRDCTSSCRYFTKWLRCLGCHLGFASMQEKAEASSAMMR